MLVKGVAKYDSRAEYNIVTSLYSLLCHEGDELVGSGIIIIVHGEHVKVAVKSGKLRHTSVFRQSGQLSKISFAAA